MNADILGLNFNKPTKVILICDEESCRVVSCKPIPPPPSLEDKWLADAPMHYTHFEDRLVNEGYLVGHVLELNGGQLRSLYDFLIRKGCIDMQAITFMKCLRQRYFVSKCDRLINSEFSSRNIIKYEQEWGRIFTQIVP